MFKCTMHSPRALITTIPAVQAKTRSIHFPLPHTSVGIICSTPRTQDTARTSLSRKIASGPSFHFPLLLFWSIIRTSGPPMLRVQLTYNCSGTSRANGETGTKWLQLYTRTRVIHRHTISPRLRPSPRSTTKWVRTRTDGPWKRSKQVYKPLPHPTPP